METVKKNPDCYREYNGSSEFCKNVCRVKKECNKKTIEKKDEEDPFI